MATPSEILRFNQGTGESGRRRMYSNQDPKDQVNTAFNIHESAFARDTPNETYVYSVGGGQSTTNKEGADYSCGRLNALHTLGLLKYAYKLEDRLKFRNLEISIENKKGGIRKWFNPQDNTHGEQKMTWPYGYIRMTEGMDGDHVDCFIGPNEQAPNVYVITTSRAPHFRTVDEQKCMLGFDSAAEAKKAFLENYTNPKFFHDMKELTYEEFERKAWATKNSNRHKIGWFEEPRNTQIGPSHDAVPGDYLGLPRTSLVGLRSVKGESMTPQDKVLNAFKYMDYHTDTSALDGNTDALPSDPAI